MGRADSSSPMPPQGVEFTHELRRIIRRHYDDSIRELHDDATFRVRSISAIHAEPPIAKPAEESEQPAATEQTNRAAHGIRLGHSRNDRIQRNMIAPTESFDE